MVHLDPAECRVLGVLVEKAFTSSAYPMSLNALTDGCNQKSNRHPVVNFDEDRVLQALDRLRAKGLVVFADALGSRVTKFRHNSREVLGVGEHELVILVELLLRGPQTPGELRGRASRMAALESLDVVHAALKSLMDRPEPLVQRIPGGRVERYAQLLCPALHPIDEPAGSFAEAPSSAEASASGSAGASATGGAPGPSGGMPAGAADRLAALEAQVTELRRVVGRLAEALGATDILTPPDEGRPA